MLEASNGSWLCDLDKPIFPPSFVVPLEVPDQDEKADEAVVVLDFALLSLLMLGLDAPPLPPVAAEATTAEALAIANPSPLRVPVAILLLAPSLPDLRPVDFVAMWTDPISESISLHMPEADSEAGKLELDTTEDASASVDHGAGLICFIFGPRKDCIRSKEALCGPRVSSSSSIGLDRYERLESVDERRTNLACPLEETRLLGPAVCGTGGRVAVRRGEEKPFEEASGTERDVLGGGECSIRAEAGIAIGGVVD